ncbi:MAG TPA: PKD-like domain-containing protein [Saprospiraceae bacterium]|nr:PKD-like domain-containing protein [Saprospiraceae bacterium]
MQRILILTLLLSASFTGSGQFTIQSSQILGGNSLDEAKDLAINSDSTKMFLGARTFSTDGDIPSNAGGSDYWIQKKTIDGFPIWNRTYGGFNNDDLTNVMPHTDGGVIGFGTTRNDQGVYGTLQGQAGGWLMRTNNNGDLIFGQIFGGTISETAVDAYRHLSGNVTMVLEASSLELDDKVNHGVQDVWIVNVDAIFNIKWTALMGGSLKDSPAAVTSDLNGNVYVAATSYSNLTGLDANAGGADVWVFKLGPQGNLLWQKNFGGSLDDVASDILVHKDGDVYVTCHSASSNGDFSPNYGSNDIWLLKLDNTNGNTKQMVRYGGSANDINAKLDRFGSTKLVIAATSNSFDHDLTGNKGLIDTWIVTIDLNGNIINQMNYGGSASDQAIDIMVVDTLFHVFSTSLSADKNVPANTLSQQDVWYMILNTNKGPCSGNFLCLPDTTLNNEIFPPSTGVLLCVEGCNAGLEQGPFFAQGPCSDFENATAFYKITTDNSSDLMTLSVTSDEINQPQIGLLKSVNCSNFTQVKCATGTNGSVLLPYIVVEPFTTYVVAITDAEGNEGSFDFCATAIHVEFCNKRDSLYVTKTSFDSPKHGPYKPGEKVQFCYELLDWNKLDCNGFQGLVPSFGPGWDPSGFDLFGMPIKVDSLIEPVSSNGFWDWFKTGDIRYNISNPINGFDGGQGMPGGWYFTNLNDPPPNSDPDETIGDIYDCLPTVDKWKVCFTLPVLEECETSLDASVTMRTFSDGEIGSHESLACAYDQEETFNASMVCCLHPGIEVINEVTICSRDTVILIPQTNILPPVTYSWIAFPDPGVSGSFSQNNAVQFGQILTNNTSGDLKVHYMLWAMGVGCETDPIEFDVKVRPLPTGRISLSGPGTICSGATVTLNFESTGTPPFAIQLFRDNVFFANVLSEQAFLSIQVDPVFSSRFRIGSIHDAFCEGDGLGLVNVTVKPVGSNVIDTSLCQGQFMVVGTQIFDETGTYTVNLPNGAENNCDSIVSLTLTIVPTTTETIEHEICHGDTVYVIEVPYFEATDEVIEYFTPEGCSNFIHLIITEIDTMYDEINQTICHGDTLEFEGQEVFQTGNYVHIGQSHPGCFQKTTLHLTVLPAITINDLSIVGDNGTGNGAILVEIIGGDPPFTFLWSNSETTGSIFELDNGTYNLTVTDSRGCTKKFSFIVPMVTATEDPFNAPSELKIWPTIVSGGEKINIYSQVSKHVEIKNLQWWDVNGRLISSIEKLSSGTPIAIESPHAASGSLCFVSITTMEGNSYWFKVIIQ